jgi:hypothetical protein
MLNGVKIKISVLLALGHFLRGVIMQCTFRIDAYHTITKKIIEL